MHRFFVPPEVIQQDNRVSLTGYLVHQIHHVLRLRPGAEIVLLDNSGWEHVVELMEVSPKLVKGVVRLRRVPANEPRTKITLYQSLLKGERFEFTLQKGTEVGIVEFVPIITDRCIVTSLTDASTKLTRWQRVILEAAEQCGRAKFPALRPALMFPAACEQASGKGLSLIPWEEETTFSLKWVLRPSAGDRPFTINLFIGPEGGFTPQEVALAGEYGIRPVTLGPRIFRAETAGLIAATAILYEMGDLGK